MRERKETCHVVRASNLSNQCRVLAQNIRSILFDHPQLALDTIPYISLSDPYSLNHRPVLVSQHPQGVRIEPIPVLGHEGKTIVVVW